MSLIPMTGQVSTGMERLRTSSSVARDRVPGDFLLWLFLEAFLARRLWSIDFYNDTRYIFPCCSLHA